MIPRTSTTSWARRFASMLAAGALALAFGAHAAPTPPGTVISNSATAAATIGATPVAPTSNTVSTTVGSSSPLNYSAVLAANSSTLTTAGSTVAIAHTLTNTGLLSDTYTLTLTPPAASVVNTSVMLPDADGNGIADSNVPIAGVVTLAPGQVFHFVAAYAVAVNAPASTNAFGRISATSAGNAPITAITDKILTKDPAVTLDCSRVTKFLSRDRGPSPAGPVKVSLGYTTCDAPRSKVVITDQLPAGMKYVPGSARWTGLDGTVLTDADGDVQGPASGSQIAYDFNVTRAGAVTAVVSRLAARSGGFVSFDVDIDSGIAAGTVIPNSARYLFYDESGAAGYEQSSEPATYLVTGKSALELKGQHLGTVTPGAVAIFTNVLTNRGDAADTFDITLSGSTFPVGTTFALFQPDGVTPLADTNGDGIPDTGVVAAGGSYNIVVKAFIPATAAPAAYKVTKTGRSITNPLVSAADDDTVDTVASKCSVTLDPDNNAQVGFGQHVTYTHFLTNHGNCSDVVRAMLDYLRDSRPGWTSKVYVDNPAAGAGSLPGVLDPSDARIEPGWTTTIGPGETLRIFVDVLAPTEEQVLAAKKAKDVVGDSNLTTLQLTPSAGAALVVRDTTIVKAGDGPPTQSDVIRNFTDGTYSSPTGWGVIGGNLYIKADAGSCNADPATVDKRVISITGPNGEHEEFPAQETGPNTGIFTIPATPVRSPPVTAGNGILEGRANDVFDVEILGCGRRISTLVTLMEPSSVVFDSHTNQPVANAQVTLVNATGGQCSTAPAVITGGANPVTTGADGRFAFPPLASGQYCLKVVTPNGYAFPSQVNWPNLPAGRNLNVTGLTSGGSYGNAFPIPVGGLLVVDLPVDPTAQAGLFVQKSASRSVVEVGEFVDYTVQVRNATGNALDQADVTLTDDLPAGFGYVTGTARRDGKAIADPQGGAGPRLVFKLGNMARDDQATILYRVRVGPGSMQGDGVNRVQARYFANGAQTLSNVATAKVQVTGGVFSNQGFILGKVFLDCNANGEQDKDELGVPGVRVVLEDGTYAVTDGGGKYSFYGLANRTHVIKVDRVSLPKGAELEVVSARNLGDAGSRIVDLKAGELHRGDFAIAGCAAPLVENIKKRIEIAGSQDELSAMFGSQLQTEKPVLTDVKALPASGVVQAAPQAGLTQTTTAAAAAVPGMQPVLPGTSDARPSPAPRIEAAKRSAPPLAPLESLLPKLDNKLGFVNLVDKQMVGFTQTPVRVKGTAGSTLKLEVNGVEVPAARIGKRSTLEDKQLQALEYIGVELKAGDNTLTVSQLDQFGNPRGSETVHVVAPDKLGRITIELPAGGGIADGHTPVIVTVKLTDERGTPVTVATPVTLDTTLGRWGTKDLNPAEPGLQVMIEGGVGNIELVPPMEPGSTQVIARSGPFKAEARLDFLPELRNLIASGVLEGIVNLRNVGTRAITPVRESDGFEQELAHLSREWNDGKTQAGARAAFYLKGKIKGDYLLTAAYDSDKDTKERLFRDIQPDEFYPIYGDSSVRGFDAQSTSKLYVRVDNGRSYLLWGDFTTQSQSPTRKLSNYSRSLTGLRQHYENERVMVDAFATRDSTRQVIDEIRANGTSGPYVMGTANALVNSEKVEIIARDRNQPSMIVSTTPQARFSDYEVEPLTGRVLFKSPVPSVDKNLNPVFVRITYEVDQGGEQFWVAGVAAQVKLTDRIEVGGGYVKDKNPLAPFALAGANATVKVAEGTYVIGEAARTQSGLDDRKGNAARVELTHESKDLKADAYVGRTDVDFVNPGASLAQGRAEAGGKLDYKLSDKTTIHGEALRTEDVASNSTRDGLSLVIQHQLAERLTFELGVRHASEKGATSAVPAVQSPDGSTLQPQALPQDVTTLRGRLTGAIPQVEGLSIYGEAEVDVRETDRRILAAGAEYQLPNKGRIYARHEFISSITGPYGLNETERQNTTAIGIDTEYMKDGKLFSEYRIRNAMAGGDTEAAVGLRNLWSIAPGLKLGTTFERVQALAGTSQNDNTAVTLAVEYTGVEWLKGSSRIEVRDGTASDSLLFTVGLAARISRDWTALARNAYTVTRNGNGGGEQVIDRMQAGLAWRDNETNKWNALARVEHRQERNDTQQGVDLKTETTLFSMHADWQPRRPFLVSGRYAAKWTTDNSTGLATKYRAQVAGARVNWEFAPRWDVSLVTSALFGESASSRQYGVGLEVGYMLATNLWASAGYNFFGYKDPDLAGADYTAKGPFIRLRYKFDETLIENAPLVGANGAKVAAPVEAAK